MKARDWAALGTGAALGIWCACRDRKYPVRRELRWVNKLAVPGCALNLQTAGVANRLLAHMPIPEPPEGVEHQSLLAALEGAAPVRLTLYRPIGLKGKMPCLLYLHGGGFYLGDAGYIHRYAAQYAAGAGCSVALVHYRTADVAPFPAPFSDCYAALRWVWDNASALQADSGRIAVGGDSAGGALAAACALRARDEGDIPLCFQLLIYPVTDSRMQTKSMQAFTDSPLWSARLNRRMWELYLRDGDCGMPQYASPMLARSFSGLPPAYVETQEFDCLHDEGIAYARALREAGVAVQIEDVGATFHGFDVFTNKRISQMMVQKRIGALRQAFRL